MDTVLYFEGERTSNLRILRAVKNRFGSTDEIGVFEMRDAGMMEVKNPTMLFEGDFGQDMSGVSIFAATQGTRPMLLEIQALCAHTSLISRGGSVRVSTRTVFIWYAQFWKRKSV